MGRRTLLLLASILVAAAGTALIWVYVQSADTRARADWATVPVLVATQAIEPGTPGSTALTRVTTRQVPAAMVPAKAFRRLSDLTARTASSSILPGQILEDGQFQAAGSSSGVSPDQQGVSVNLADPNRAAGLLHPGMNVAVYYVDDNSQAGKAGDGGIVVLLPKARVIAVGNTTVVRNALGKPAQIGTQSGVAAANVILDLKGADAAKVILAATRGTLWFGVLGEGAQGDLKDGLSATDLPVPPGKGR